MIYCIYTTILLKIWHGLRNIRLLSIVNIDNSRFFLVQESGFRPERPLVRDMRLL